MLAIIDSGIANVRSVANAFAALECDAVITADPAVIREADRLVLPGVGAFADGMKNLRERGLTHCFVVGLATDFCVAWTALDARHLGFEATVIEDACRAIDTGGSLERAWNDMQAAGVTRMRLGYDA